MCGSGKVSRQLGLLPAGSSTIRSDSSLSLLIQIFSLKSNTFILFLIMLYFFKFFLYNIKKKKGLSFFKNINLKTVLFLLTTKTAHKTN